MYTNKKLHKKCLYQIWTQYLNHFQNVIHVFRKNSNKKTKGKRSIIKNVYRNISIVLSGNNFVK